MQNETELINRHNNMGRPCTLQVLWLWGGVPSGRGGLQGAGPWLGVRGGLLRAEQAGGAGRVRGWGGHDSRTGHLGNDVTIIICACCHHSCVL